MYKRIKMHRTHKYILKKNYFEALKIQANSLGLSLSAYIRNTLKEDLDERKKTTTSIRFFRFLRDVGKQRDNSRNPLEKKPGNDCFRYQYIN